VNRCLSFSDAVETWLRGMVIDSCHNQIIAELSFPANLSAFQGHFPCSPILPGVFLVSVVRILADEMIASNFIPFYYENIKFKQAVLPEQHIDLIIKVKNNNGRYCLSFKYTSAVEPVAGGSIYCRIKK
jgi:3-hydroxymyristoyl/3-hydroxydecanoyl-(acyl carrier protein) dehydratase